MNKTEKFVITINRQFGTGGHAIGAELATRLGVKLIDKQILLAVARQFNLTEEEARQLEARKPSWWEDFSQFYQTFISVNPPAQYAAGQADVTSRQLFHAQARVMREVAATESCVVIGRCGFHIFRDEPNALRIFLHSPMDKRLRRIEERYHVSEDKARVMIEDNDYTRELYTKTFTGHDWYDARNYDLTLDVGDYGVNGAVDFLMGYIGA